MSKIKLGLIPFKNQLIKAEDKLTTNDSGSVIDDIKRIGLNDDESELTTDEQQQTSM
jgi:hypothetical protein